MRFEIVFLLVLVAAYSYATLTVSPKNEGERFLISANSISFTTFTLVKSTTTVSSTLTVTTTCTTSTAILLTCTTGRRRRGLFYDETAANTRHRRAGLYYNAEDNDNKEGSAFLPTNNSDPINEVPVKAVADESVIPLEIQSGFSLPEGVAANRFLLAFGVSTLTSVVVSTSTVSLTAICLSTTGFPLCGAVGK